MLPNKTNMAMENPPFEDVFHIEHVDFPASHVTFRECITRQLPSLKLTLT